MTILLLILSVTIQIHQYLSAQCQNKVGKIGLWFTIDGLDYPCASTTKTYDTTQGACGCGKNSTAIPWVSQIYSAGASFQVFGNVTLCGMGCGKCFSITPTGYSPSGKGVTNISSITIMVTNLCS